MKVTIEMTIEQFKEYATNSYGARHATEVLSFREGDFKTNHTCTESERKALLKKGQLCHCPNEYKMREYPTEFKIIETKP